MSTAVDVEQQAPEEGSLSLAVGVIASVCRLDVDRGVAAYALGLASLLSVGCRLWWTAC